MENNKEEIVTRKEVDFYRALFYFEAHNKVIQNTSGT